MSWTNFATSRVMKVVVNFHWNCECCFREEAASVCGRTDWRTTRHPISSPELCSKWAQNQGVRVVNVCPGLTPNQIRYFLSSPKLHKHTIWMKLDHNLHHPWCENFHHGLLIFGRNDDLLHLPRSCQLRGYSVKNLYGLWACTCSCPMPDDLCYPAPPPTTFEVRHLLSELARALAQLPKGCQIVTL